MVGVDAGATSTRVAVHTLGGARVGYAIAGPGNPTAHGLTAAVAAVADALREALGSLAGARVVSSLAGVAGHVEEMVPELTTVWAEHGIARGPRYLGDVQIAYAAGSSEPDGALLLSGTGAVAARIVDFDLDALADGLGWLLGDAGSGFWIGREAAKAVVHALDRGLPVEALLPEGEGGELVRLVGGHFLGAERRATPRAAADRIVRLAQADHMRLAALSSLVSRAAEAGDPLAVEIVQEAAGHLVTTLRRVHAAGPVVLAGSVLTSEGPVRAAVMRLLAGETVTTARDAAGAAAWLAARELLPAAEARARHAAFTTGS
ncbi:BadF-type ATPase [Nonomuraea jiangxiensis]|uniref:BadF-type ATPase n=1 Tax=Nonomuraea jiangxiensis TaxID=633440 RepID=A0A1G9NM12_9ACTN|nr:BadF-type ATPase [Nonomuraea jiangxiensis]